MAELFTNNASSTLAGAITSSATSLTVQTGDGTKFPALSGSDFFRCTLVKKSTLEFEIVKVTARNVDNFTITRAQEGTTALALDASDLVELRPTAGFFQSMLTDSDVQSGAYSSSADTGTANNYVLTLNPAPTAYGAHQRFSFVAGNANTGASVINVNGLGNKSIKKNGGADELVANDIKAGSIVVIEYDGTDFQLISSVDREPVFSDQPVTFQESVTLAKRLSIKKGADIASANDCVLLNDGNYNNITGSLVINGFTNGVQNETRKFHFTGAATLKHATAPSAGFSQLFLPNGKDYVTQANDEIEFTYDGTYWRVTGAALAGASLGDTGSPVGTTIIWNTNTVPDGYLEENGQAVSRTTYADLFAVIGVQFGAGDGSTTFNLDDKRGRFLRGWSNASGVDPDAASRTDRGDGVTGDNVGTKQSDQLKSHTHTEQYWQGTGTGGSYPAGTNFQSNGTGTFANDPTGGNETRPVNTNVMFCIKY